VIYSTKTEMTRQCWCHVPNVCPNSNNMCSSRSIGWAAS